MTKRIIVPGSKSFNNYPLEERVLNELLPQYGEDIEIVSGHAEGADRFGEIYAERHNIKCAVFPAQWEKYGKKAGPIRNSQMIKYAKEQEPAIIAFWNGHSKGTLDTLVKAMNDSIPTTIIIYNRHGNYKTVRFVYDE